MNAAKTETSDLPIYLTVAGGLLMGAVAIPFVQANFAGTSVGLTTQISLVGGLLLATTASLLLGLCDFLRPSANRAVKRRPTPDADEPPLLGPSLSGAA